VGSVLGTINQAFPKEQKDMPIKDCGGLETKFEKCIGSTPVCEKCEETINCEVGPWTAWSSCECDGLRERSRRILHSNNECGTPCDETLVETAPCGYDEIECLKEPKDCQWKATTDNKDKFYNGTDPDLGWGAWSSCEVAEKPGDPLPTQKTRVRLYKESEHGGAGCTGDLSQTEACPVNKARIGIDDDCEWSVWSEWGACTCPCGGGQQTRYRHVATAPKGRGKLCDPLTKAEIVPCNTQSCSDPCQPKDAKWGEWSEWGQCSNSCGEGKRWRNRTLAVKAECGGSTPDGSSVEIGACPTLPDCGSIDCQFNEWSDWSDCSCTCEGIKHRFRTIASYGDHGGAHCVGPLKQVAECHEYTSNPDCFGGPRIDCVQEWSEWTACDKNCGGGQRYRNNSITKAASNGGRGCDDTMAEVEPCNTDACGDEPQPIPCAMSEWTDWSDCDKCGGQKRRNRHITQMPRNKGPPCEDPETGEPWPAEETAACKRQCYHGEPACCVWGAWQAVGGCQTASGKDCGPGLQKLQRKLSWGSCDATTTTTTTPGSTTTVTTCITVVADQELFDVESLNSRSSHNLVLSFVAGSVVTFFVSFMVLRATRNRQRGFEPVELLE
jgi:hypothetical protein